MSPYTSGAKFVDAQCPTGKKVVGGGAAVYEAGGDVALDESLPVTTTSWRATTFEVNATAELWAVRAYAICAAVAA
jgi:hypothetical protein